jgi:XTP/dITP diphosphohydrolase
MKLIFASGNAYKLSEIRSRLKGICEVIPMFDLGFNEDIPETAATLEENAALKARFIFKKFALPCFADDSGLEVRALEGRPGVYSARYAGENCTAGDNVLKLLKEMHHVKDRTALFRTVFHLCTEGCERSVEGAIQGRISIVSRGESGFGYDPIFIPDGHTRTFAEMSLEEKNSISHRALATEKLVHVLRSLNVVSKHL